MIENFVESRVYKEFKLKTENVDKLAQWAFSRKKQQIAEKYSNIDTTIKILNGLVGDFVRKADRIEETVTGMIKIS